MKKYEIVKKSKEITWKDRKEIAEGCTMDDAEPETIASFETLEEARKELKKYKARICEMGGMVGKLFEVEEYMIVESDDEDRGIYDVCEISKMKIEVNEIPGYKVIASFGSYEDAEDFVNQYDGEVFITF